MKASDGAYCLKSLHKTAEIFRGKLQAYSLSVKLRMSDKDADLEAHFVYTLNVMCLHTEQPSTSHRFD